MIKTDENHSCPLMYKMIRIEAITTTFLFSTHMNYTYEEVNKGSKELFSTLISTIESELRPDFISRTTKHLTCTF